MTTSQGARGPETPRQAAATWHIKPRAGVFKYSPWDALLVILALIEIAGSVAAVRAAPQLAWGGALALGALLVALNCTNYQCISHNFIHNPFFNSRPANNLFSVINTLALGSPQTLYRMHHLNHHKYNSDRRDPVTGATLDHSSIYRYGRGDDPEPLWAYSLLGPLRTDLWTLFQLARTQKAATLVYVEVAALFLFWIGLIAVSPWGFFLFYVPVWYLGQASSYAENYLEHYKAIPGDRLTDSVSCYGALYNALWFNNGYHQEHHYLPYVHWTRIRQVRSQMLPSTSRRVVRGAHFFNLA